MERMNKYRIGAFITDAVFVAVVAGILETLFASVMQYSTFELLGSTFKFTYSFVMPSYIIYYLFFDLVNNGTSLGKIIFKLKVMHENKTPLGLRKLVKRTLFKCISILLLPISILLFALTNGYTIHDAQSNTITIQNQ